MLVEPRTLKGFRDFLPSDARKRSYVINSLKKVFESFGFEPLETPVLEYEEILLGKYGDEGDKLMYRFTDNGERRVAMRYDQTVPLARVIAQYANDLPFPFKRYQVSNVYRAENTQRGRFREFTQCDIDIVGINSAFSDAEILFVVIRSLEILGIKNFKILVNDRTVFKDTPKEAIIIIDKLKKIGEEAVLSELSQKGLDTQTLSNIKSAQITDRLQQTINIVSDERVIFTPTLARGLDYYTGIIIEVEIEGYEAGSVGGGGRYDNLIGMFSKNPIPAVGFAFGFDRLLEALDSMNLFKMDPSITKVLVSVFSKELQKKSLETVTLLRKKGINAEIYLEAAPMEKQLKYAIKKQIPYLLVIGPEEVEKDMVTLKALDTRQQQTLTLSDALNIIA